jgi:hypothetical protein
MARRRPEQQKCEEKSKGLFKLRKIFYTPTKKIRCLQTQSIMLMIQVISDLALFGTREMQNRN